MGCKFSFKRLFLVASLSLAGLFVSIGILSNSASCYANNIRKAIAAVGDDPGDVLWEKEELNGRWYRVIYFHRHSSLETEETFGINANNTSSSWHYVYTAPSTGSVDVGFGYTDIANTVVRSKNIIIGDCAAKIYLPTDVTSFRVYSRYSNDNRYSTTTESLTGNDENLSKVAFWVTQDNYSSGASGGDWLSHYDFFDRFNVVYFMVDSGWHNGNSAITTDFIAVEYKVKSNGWGTYNQQWSGIIPVNPCNDNRITSDIVVQLYDNKYYAKFYIPQDCLQFWIADGEDRGGNASIGNKKTISNANNYLYRVTSNKGSEQDVSYGLFSFTIDYDLDDGTHAASYPTSYVYGVGATLDSPTKDDVVFGGYYYENDFSGARINTISTTKSGNVTVYAKWQCELTWLNDNGDELATTYVDVGSTPVYTGSTPTKESSATHFYEFNGWDNDISEPVTENTTFTATYIAATAKLRIYLNKNWGGTPLVGNGFGPANQPAAVTSIAADKNKHIPASGTSVVASHSDVQDFAVPEEGQNNICVTYFEGDVRWIPWRGSQRRDSGGLRNSVGLYDNFDQLKFYNGYIYSMTSFSGSDPHTNAYDDPYDGKYRDCKWYTYSIERVGVFVHYDLNQGTHATLSTTPDYEHSYNTDLTLASAPTRPGYTFMGWEDSISGLVNRAGSTYKNLTQPISLRAVWKSNTISVVPSDKIRIWVAYDYNNSIGIDSLLYSGLGNTCKLWLHDGESSGTTYSLLVEPSGTYYNTGENIHDTNLPNCPRRYDYFDIPRIYFDNEYYVTVQKFNDAGVWQAQTSNAAHLSSTDNYSFKVLYLNCALDYGVKKWWFNSVTQGYGLAATDAMFAALGLAGMHTCDDDLMNGYGGYSKWRATFLQDVSESSLSAYIITDFCDGSSYASDTDINRSTNAYSKFLMIQANASGGSRGFSLSNFLNGSHGEESQMSAIIIIVVSSVSLLSLTALAILMVKKRKTQ